MSREQAWQWADRAWCLRDPSDEPVMRSVQDSIKRLQSQKLPIAAIEEITTLLKAHEAYILDSFECATCEPTDEVKKADATKSKTFS